jgi:hypothetical protein
VYSQTIQAIIEVQALLVYTRQNRDMCPRSNQIENSATSRVTRAVNRARRPIGSRRFTPKT